MERPSQDFFCPVSLELLLEPQLISCCGHHLSLDVTKRLQRERKPCPMCNAQGWSTVLDKYHLRKVNQVHVRCWHKGRGCRWEGEVRSLKGHADSCVKRSRECGYCGARGGGEHWSKCEKFPEPCPNCCEVGSVERCGMEQHRSVCPLEPMACEMKEFGCSVVLPRKELVRHMKESELQHLTAMTALNLRLTRQMQQESAERGRKINQLQQEVAYQKEEITKLQAMDHKISEVTRTVVRMEYDMIESIRDQKQMIKTYSADTSKQKGQMEALKKQASQIQSCLSRYVVQEIVAGVLSTSGTKIFKFDDYMPTVKKAVTNSVLHFIPMTTDTNCGS